MATTFITWRIALAFLLAGSAAPALAAAAPDAAWWVATTKPRAATYDGYSKSSLYVPMTDGTRLAVDVYLPPAAKAGERFPTVFQQTRYYRSAVTEKNGAASCKVADSSQSFFLARGYAFVVADVRGTGASFGARIAEFSRAEVKDSAVLARWIARQPWSSGRIGAFGVSYPGTAAELLLGEHVPAVKAAAVISGGYDFYSDIDFPGGVKNTRFISSWGAVNAGLDAAGRGATPMPPGIKGPCPVDADPDEKLLDAALAEHAANANSAGQMADVRFRDDPTGPEGWPSPYRSQARIDASRTPLYAFVGWTDSAYAQGGINRFLNSTSGNQRLTIGAVSHGGRFFYGPGVEAPTTSAFERNAELLRFFDHYVARLDNGFEHEARVHYFMTGANRWVGAAAWPQPKARLTYCLSANGALAAGCVRTQPVLASSPMADVETGSNTRWDTTLGGGPVAYAERIAATAKGLNFTGSPLTRAVDLVGNPVLNLALEASVADAVVFVTLEDVDPQGRAFYVTEGQLRASHSRPGALPYRSGAPQHSDARRDALGDLAGRALPMQIRLQPTAHRFLPGHAIRISLFSSDKAHFGGVTASETAWRVRVDGGPGSSLVLPVQPAVAP